MTALTPCSSTSSRQERDVAGIVGARRRDAHVGRVLRGRQRAHVGGDHRRVPREGGDDVVALADARQQDRGLHVWKRVNVSERRPSRRLSTPIRSCGRMLPRLDVGAEVAHEPGLLRAARGLEDQPLDPGLGDQRVDQLVADRAVRPVQPGVAGDAAFADDRVRAGVERLGGLAHPQLRRRREPPVLAADLDEDREVLAERLDQPPLVVDRQVQRALGDLDVPDAAAAAAPRAAGRCARAARPARSASRRASARRRARGRSRAWPRAPG